VASFETRRNSPLGKFSEGLPPVPLLAKAGSISIRDLRMWHRGTPNRSTEPRPMLSMICNLMWAHIIHAPTSFLRVGLGTA
jgi:hypothetical protein